MKLTRLLALTIGAAWFGLSIASAAEPPAITSISTLAANISKATTASDSIAAYARATAVAGENDVTIEQAFVSRMVDLGEPELAEAQALDLVSRTRSGLPAAVLAYSSARKAQIDPAIDYLAAAVKSSPTNEFVGRTAGEIVAWYEAQPEDGKGSEANKQKVEDIRQSMKSRPSYSDAYDAAHKASAAPVEDQGLIVNVVGKLGDLTTFSANNGSGPYAASPMSAFYAAPYLAFPNYSYGYQPWGPRFYGNGAFARVGQRVPFPTPRIGLDQRYIRTPTPNNGFVLVNDDGSASYFPAYYPQPYFASYYPYADYAPIYFPGYYPPGIGYYAPGYGGYGGRFAGYGYGGGYGGSGRQGIRNNGFGGPRAHISPGLTGFGQRGFINAAGQTPFQPMSTPFQPVTTPFQGPAMGVQPGLQRMR